MIKNWTKARAILKKYEGGNVDHPRDPGGRTSRGVTQRVYDAYRMRKGRAKQDVYKATEAEVSEIYKIQYWDAARCNDLPDGIDLVVFDTTVNSGQQRAYKLLQASLAKRGASVRVDGSVGMVTIEAAKNDEDHDMLIAEFGRHRQAFYRGLKTWNTFGAGWTARNKNCTQIAQAWASGSVGPPPIKIETDVAKAYDADIARANVNPSTGFGITTGSAVANGGVEAVQAQIDSAQSALYPLAGYMEYVQHLLTLLVVVGVCVTFYSLYRNWRAKKVEDAIDSYAMNNGQVA